MREGREVEPGFIRSLKWMGLCAAEDGGPMSEFKNTDEQPGNEGWTRLEIPNASPTHKLTLITVVREGREVETAFIRRLKWMGASAAEDGGSDERVENYRRAARQLK